MTTHRRWLPVLLAVFVTATAFVTAAAFAGPCADRATAVLATDTGQAAGAASAAQDVKQAKAESTEPQLTVDEMTQFLLKANIIKSRGTPKGITAPSRLTLTDGKITHDAGFQTIDESAPRREFANGTIEFNFVDSYRYDIAAYRLATLIGLGDMMPVTVERSWNGRTGALSWWLPTEMDEQTRTQKKIRPPDVDAWNRQMYKKWIFAELVYDTDPNMTNILVSADWHMYMIDFSRAFRLSKDLRDANNVEKAKCPKELLERLRSLTRDEVVKAVNGKLMKYEIDGVMARRDKIVAIFDKRVKNGEKDAVY